MSALLYEPLFFTNPLNRLVGLDIRKAPDRANKQGDHLMKNRTYNPVAAAIMSIGVLCTPYTQAQAELANTTVNLAFVTHLDMNLPEQDVFIEREPGSDQVHRVTKGDHNMNAELFASAIEVKHNPFDPTMNGPYPKGASLGMNLGDWLKHSGKGRYTYEDGEGSLDLAFHGLVPNGVYTMWIAFVPVVPPKPFPGALELPLGAPDGSETLFTADEHGQAVFKHSFRPGLEMSDHWTKSMLAIAYHSDGRTYAGSPGPFGKVTHVPLISAMPNRKGVK